MIPAMVVTLVLRLLDKALERGDLVGHVELVASGITEPVRSADDVVAFARRVIASEASPDSMPPAAADHEERRVSGRG